jgi:hypothetical protein
MLCLWLKLLLPSTVFGGTIQLHDFGEGNNELVLCLCPYTATSGIGSQVFSQIMKAKKNAARGDEPDDSLTTFKTVYEATGPVCEPGPYASGENGPLFMLKSFQPEMHGMPERGDKSGELEMRKGSKKRGGNDSCGEGGGCGCLGEEMGDERLIS